MLLRGTRFIQNRINPYVSPPNGAFPSECQRTPKPAKTFCRFGVFSYYLEVSATGLFAEAQCAEKACTASVFAFLRNLPTTVSIYADAGKLLVFGAPLTSGSLSKNEFFDRLKRGASLLSF